MAAADIGARIDSLRKGEITIKIPLPPLFFKEPPVKLRAIEGRLDEGIEVLKSRDSKLDKLVVFRLF